MEFGQNPSFGPRDRMQTMDSSFGETYLLLTPTCKHTVLCPQFRRSEERGGGGILVWSSACVRPLRFAYGQERLEIGSWNLICGNSMKNKRTRIFFFLFSSDFSLQSYALFLRYFDCAIISLWNLDNKISGEQLGLGSWYLTHRLSPKV